MFTTDWLAIPHSDTEQKNRSGMQMGERITAMLTTPNLATWAHGSDLISEATNMEKKQKRRIGGVWQDPDSGIWRYRFMYKGCRYFGTVPEAKNKTEAKDTRDRRRIAVREGREDKAEASANFKAFVKDNFLPWIETN